MKNIIALLCCVLALSVKSQDIEFVTTLNKIDSVDVFSVTEEIFAEWRDDYHITGQIEKGYDRTVILHKKDLPKDVVLKDINEWGQHCQLCETVKFKIYYAGSNKDLEIKGKKTYYLYSISGPFLDLAGWWRKHFAQGKTDEEILESYNLRVVQDRTKRVDIRLSRSGDEWQILNVY